MTTMRTIRWRDSQMGVVSRRSRSTIRNIITTAVTEVSTSVRLLHHLMTARTTIRWPENHKAPRWRSPLSELEREVSKARRPASIAVQMTTMTTIRWRDSQMGVVSRRSRSTIRSIVMIWISKQLHFDNIVRLAQLGLARSYLTVPHIHQRTTPPERTRHYSRACPCAVDGWGCETIY